MDYATKTDEVSDFQISRFFALTSGIILLLIIRQLQHYVTFTRTESASRATKVRGTE